jgi:AcrR family transcriptional regulator
MRDDVRHGACCILPISGRHGSGGSVDETQARLLSRPARYNHLVTRYVRPLRPVKALLRFCDRLAAEDGRVQRIAVAAGGLAAIVRRRNLAQADGTGRQVRAAKTRIGQEGAMSDSGDRALPARPKRAKAKPAAVAARSTRKAKAPVAKSSSNPSAKPPRRPAPRSGPTRDPQRTSAAILAAAVKEFMEKGFGGARVNTIATRANINKRMLYHYFGDKEALYFAVLEGVYVGIRTAETKLHLLDRDPIEGMRELITFTWRYFLDHPEFLSLLATENLHRAKYLKRSTRIFDLHSPLISGMADLLRRGAANGQFRQDTDPVKIYISIAALGFFYLSNRWTLSTIFRRELATESELASWGAHIVEVVLSYLRP